MYCAADSVAKTGLMSVNLGILGGSEAYTAKQLPKKISQFDVSLLCLPR